MQASDVIWLLAGIGIGLTVAMLILAGVLVVDGQRFKRRLSLASSPEEALRPAPAPRAPVVPRTVEARPKTIAGTLAAAVPAVPVRSKEPIVADPKQVEPAAAVVDEMMSDLAAEIARMQAPEPVAVEVEPVPEPVQVVAEPVAPPAPELPPAPAPPQAAIAPPEPVAAPEPVAEPVVEEVTAPVAEEPEAPPLVLAPVIQPAPAPPKLPPLPKVTPARKFAPALPPRNPPEPKS